MGKMKLALICGLSLMIILVGFGGGVCNAANKIQLTMGSTNSTSSHYTAAIAMAKVIHDTYPEIFVTVAESGASIDNLQRMARGEFDFGISTSNASYVAVHGLEQFKGNANKKVRWLYTYGNVPILLFTRKATNINNIYELKGRKFNPSGVGGSSAAIVERALTALGIEPNFYRGSYSDAVEAIQNKQIEGMAKTHGGGKNRDALIMRIQASLPVNFLSFTPEDIKKIQVKYPYFKAYTLEPNVYKDQPEKILSVGMSVSIVTQKDLPDDVAYKIVKATIDGQAQVGATFKGLKNFDMLNATVQTATVPLHVGAIRYFKERGIKIPESLIPSEYK